MKYIVPFMILMGGVAEVSAKYRSSGSSGSSFRSSSSKSYSKPSSSSKYSSSSKPKSTTSSSKYSSSSKPKTVTKPKPMTFKSPKEKAAYEKAKKSGTAFSSKADAQKAFKEKHADKYKSTYATKPATRPDHIPQTTTGPNGNTYNITYNQNQGGYGYTNSLGAFIMYDAMSDAVMMSALMSRNNYVVHADHGKTVTHTVHHSSGGPSGWAVLWTIVIVFAVIGFIVFILVKA